MRLKTSIATIFLITVMLYSSITFSQDASLDLKSYHNVFPPTPTEAALGKYGTFPVSLYSGIPSINIPLFEIKEKNLTVLISLSYHASGIKVEERAGWVGLGWSLNAGGVITRTMVGKVDELPSGYWQKVIDASIPSPYLNEAGFSSYSPTYEDLCRAIKGDFDFEPDQFSFNFMGFSGSLIINPYEQTNGIRDCYLFPQADIEIKYDNGIFTAIDYKGVQYKFDQTNSVSTFQHSGSEAAIVEPNKQYDYVTTWYLSEIYDPNTGARISFNYSPKNEEYVDRMISTENISSPGTKYSSYIENSYSATSQFIESISTNSQEVEFDILNRAPNSDMNKGYILDKCSLRDKSDINKVLSYSFQYDYPNNRLMLGSIVKNGVNNEDGGTYQFEYYPGIPPRDSKSRDFWGFYNGKNNTTLFYPYMDIFPYTANLSPDKSGIFMQAGSLKSITYPTKGITTFEYEPHQFKQTSGSSIQLPELPSNNEILNNVRVSYPQLLEVDFVVDFDQTATFSINEGFQHDYFYIKYSSNNFEGSKLLSFNQNVQQIFLKAGTYKLYLQQIRAEDPEGSINEFNSVSVDYKSTETVINPGSGTATNSNYAGGLRIKRITNYTDGSIANTKEYSYNLWKNGFRTDESSGMLAGFENNYSSKFAKIKDGGYNVPEIREMWYQRINASSISHPLTQGASVNYEYVEERDNANGMSNGFILSKFDSIPDNLQDDFYSDFKFVGDGDYGPNLNPTYPNAIRDDKGYLRGKILSKTYFNSNGYRVMEENYNYSNPIKEFSIPGIKAGIYFHNLSEELELESMHKFVYTKYQRSAYSTKLLSKFVSHFDGISDSDAAYGKTYTSYTRNQKNQIEKEEIVLPSKNINHATMNEESDIITNEYFYPNSTDFPTNYDLNVTAAMVNMGMYSVPIISSSKRNGVLVEMVRRNYSAETPILLDSIELTHLDTNHFYTKASFKYINSQPIQLNTPGGYCESYYWNTNYEQPIAKFINLPFLSISDDLEYLLNLLRNSKVGNELERTTLKSLNATIRNTIPEILVTTYTYDPLFGITTQTDPNGITTYYEYDGLGRLNTIRDSDFNLLKKYNYHYVGQNITDNFFNIIVSFESQGGEPIPSFSTNRGIVIPEPDIPYRDGYTFNGWYKDSSCTNAWNFSTDIATSNTTLYAKWTINTYTVSFNSQGGTTIGNAIITHGSKVAVPTEPTRVGYTFDGWYKESSYTTRWNFATDVVTSNTTLYAKWINGYVVTFDSQGGTSVPNIIAMPNSYITLPTSITKNGFVLEGWYKQKLCLTEWIYDYDKVTAPITLYAKWVEKCTVVFDSQGGSAVSSIDVPKSTTISAPTAPARDGYSFVGWFKEPACTNPWSFASDVVSSNTVLYAKWAIRTYTVSASVASSGGSMTPSGSSTVNHGEGIAYTFTPSTGYHIKDVKVNGTSVGSVSGYTFSNITLNQTLAVEFEINSYTITSSLVGGGGNINPLSPISINHGGSQSYTITPSVGYHIKTVLVNGQSLGAIPSYTFPSVTSNQSISAEFEINTYSITASIVGSGGSMTPSGSSTVNHGGNITYTIAPLSGYHTKSIKVDGNSVEPAVKYMFTGVTQNHTLQVEFEINTYTVSFNSQGGTTIGNSMITHGSKVAVPTQPTRVGYTFDGWYKESSCTYSWNFTTDVVTSDMTLYAKWINGYVVTFDSQGGTGVPSIIAVPNSYIALPAALTKEGYIFGGWYKQRLCFTEWIYDYDKVTAPITLYAKWTEKCTVVFNSQGGSAVSSIDAPKSTTISAPTAPARDGYNFVGWFKEPACTNPWSFTSDVVNSNTTLYAKWAVKTYTVSASIASGGGSITPSGSSTVNHGGSITYAFTPSTGYAVKNVLVNGNSVGAANSYTLANVTSSANLQVEFGEILLVNRTDITFGSYGGTLSFNITSSTSWTITSTGGWFTVTPLSGSGNATINIFTRKYISGSPRIGTITVTGGGITKTINVKQYGDNN